METLGSGCVIMNALIYMRLRRREAFIETCCDKLACYNVLDPVIDQRKRRQSLVLMV